jgi:hypothetical protein
VVGFAVVAAVEQVDDVLLELLLAAAAAAGAARISPAGAPMTGPVTGHRQPDVVGFAVDEEAADTGVEVLVVVLGFDAAVVVLMLACVLLLVAATPVVLVAPVIKQLQAEVTLAALLEQPDNHVGTAAAEVVVIV